MCAYETEKKPHPWMMSRIDCFREHVKRRNLLCIACKHKSHKEKKEPAYKEHCLFTLSFISFVGLANIFSMLGACLLSEMGVNLLFTRCSFSSFFSLSPRLLLLLLILLLFVAVVMIVLKTWLIFL